MPATTADEIAAAKRRVTTPASIGLLLLRIGFAAILFIRGLSHATNIDTFTNLVSQSNNPIPIPDSVAAWITVVGELGLPVLLLFGFLTRIAGALTVVLMGLIYYAVHYSGPGALITLSMTAPTGPINGEPAVAIGIVGLVLLFTGPGRIAIDNGFRRNRLEAAEEPAAVEPTPAARPVGNGPVGNRPVGNRPAGPAGAGQGPAASGPRSTGAGRPAGGATAAGSTRPQRGRGDRDLPEDPKNWTDEDIQRL